MTGRLLLAALASVVGLVMLEPAGADAAPGSAAPAARKAAPPAATVTTKPAAPPNDEAAPAAEEAAPTSAAAEPDDAEGADEAAKPEPAAVDGPIVVDTVLDSGVRVVIARDASLPVASVVLAIETGTEDDPSERPGLVHALAYHLLQGNRELPPGGIARIAHDSGGVTSLAIGPAQIRYESLVPVSLLDEMLWAESQRLRAPTVDDALWRDSLSWARRDPERNWALPGPVLAQVHGAEGLAHPGRKASAQLESLGERLVALELAQRMTYTRATLVVVSPRPPHKVLDRVRELFADLPDAPRRITQRPAPPTGADGPRQMSFPGGSGTVFAWPVRPGSVTLEWARIWCRTINRQRRAPDEPARARLRCHLDIDPRRATLILRASGVDDPLALVQARLARIDSGDDDTLIEAQRRVVADDLALELSTPLGLARRLAMADPDGPNGGRTDYPEAEVTGMATLGRRHAHRDVLTGRYPLEAALWIIAAEQGGEQEP